MLGDAFQKLSMKAGSICNPYQSMASGDDGRTAKTAKSRANRDSMYTRFTGRHERNRQWEEFVPGTLICVIEHRTNLDSRLDETDEHISRAKSGEYIYTKYRYFLVIAKYTRHLTVLCIYTHNGKGLSGVPEDMRFEYVAIQPHALGPGWVSMSPHEPL